MRRLAALTIVLLASAASAQPADFPLVLESGVYTVKAQMGSDSDTTEFCVVRVDLAPVVEFGCVPAGADEIVSMAILVTVTEGDDAEIRGYAAAVNPLGIREVSAYSPNAAIVDFTPIAAPLLVQ